MALYHKHRPQIFTSVIGQEHIVTTLSNQVAGNKVAHAYLFSGPRGVGKTTLARILAKAINCPNRKPSDFEPCDQCDPCQEIRGSRSIDVIGIDAASHTGVDNVRENIIDNAQFKPTKSPFKIFIIDEVHMLSTSAFNALLKTLEEPPKHVIFIMATTELHKLPATIISRCQRFDFKKVGFDTMEKHLKAVAKEEGVKIDEDVLERIINKSDGCVRDSVGLLDQIMAAGEKNITAEIASLVLPTTNAEQCINYLSALLNKDTKAGIELVAQLVEDGVNFPQFAYDTVEILRAMLILKTGAKASQTGLDLNDKAKKEIKNLCDLASQKDLVNLIDLLMRRGAQIKSSPIPQLPLEMAVVEWVTTTDTKNTDHTDKPIDQLPVTSYRLPKNQDEPKKTIVERVKEMVSKEPAFTITDVQSKWNNFLDKVEKQFPSLAFVLKMAEIDMLDGNTVKIKVQYSFHRDKIMEKACQKNLETLLAEILGDKAKIEANVADKQDITTSNEELQSIASSLGGEIVS